MSSVRSPSMRTSVLAHEGRFVPLRPKDLELLLALVENSGRLVEKDELLSASGRTVS
jgi:DNA-binding winged helix-turn-helix (wHTH) protein